MPTWELYPDQKTAQTAFGVAHFFFGLFLTYRGAQAQSHWKQPNLCLVYGSLIGIVLFWLYIDRVANFSRVILLLTLVLSVLLHSVAWFGYFCLSRRLLKFLTGLPLCLSLFGLVAMFSLSADSWSKAKRMLKGTKPQVRQTNVLSSNFYDIQVDYFQNYLPYPFALGGGMAAWGDKVFLVTGDGFLYLFQDRGKDGLEIEELAIRVPINRQDFVDDLGKEVRDDWFRTAGICLDVVGNEIKLWISHHHWDSAEQLIRVRVSSISGTLESFADPATNRQWRTFYETHPGLPLLENPKSGNPFVGVEIGGRIQCLDEERLILSVGEQGYDGWENELAVSQDPQSPFGKILVLSKETGQAEIYSSGHRNPQGLCVTSEGEIWSTEHGPKGGDELNLIERGENYGWPVVTLGSNYYDTSWPLSSSQGSHDGFAWPIYSWSPSIAVSNLIQVRGAAFPIWQGDFLISSLTAGTIFRTRVRQGRVIEAEPLQIGRRIRDVVEVSNGLVYLWSDSGELIRLSPIPGSDLKGETAFAKCQVCHTSNLQGQFTIGPDLRGVLGRKIASSSGYDYSPAIRKVKGKWSIETLDAFLKDPQAFAHGSKMNTPGLDEPNRKSVLEFLKNY